MKNLYYGQIEEIKKIKEICVLNKKIPNVIFFFYKINLFIM